MGNSNLPSKILVVDNDQAVVNSVNSLCTKHQIGCIIALNWQNALYHFNKNRFDVCLVELDLQEMNGAILLQKWRHHEMEGKRSCPFILLLGKPQKAGENALATEIGDTLFMKKPIKEPQLLSLLAKTQALKKQRDHLQEVKEKLLDPLLAKGDKEALKGIATGKLKSMGQKGQELAAKVLEEAEEIDLAIGEYHSLHNRTPSNMHYMNEIGRLQMTQGNLNEAKAAFEEADKIAPQNILRLKDMAKMYLMRDEPDKGVHKYQEILKIDPDNPDQKFDMFETLQSFGYDKHAEELCKKTTKPLELIRHYNNKGVLFSKDGRYVDAIDEYKKAQRLIPQSKELYRILFNEALAHINLKHEDHMEIALKILTRCVKLKPDYEKAKEKIKMLADLGYDEAV